MNRKQFSQLKRVGSVRAEACALKKARAAGDRDKRLSASQAAPRTSRPTSTGEPREDEQCQ
jgi:hypothetical protein